MKPRRRSGTFSVPAAVLERTGSLRKRRPCAVSSMEAVGSVKPLEGLAFSAAFRAFFHFLHFLGRHKERAATQLSRLVVVLDSYRITC